MPSNDRPMALRNTATTAGPIWWREISAGFIRSIARKGRRPNTLIVYGFALRDFGRWIELQAISDAEQLTGSHIERWQDQRASEIKASTHQCYAAAMRGVLRWAATQEPPLCPPTLWLRVVTPRKPSALPKPIPRADLEKLLAAFDTWRPLSGITRPSRGDLLRLRTRALFLTILSSGARISEALQLQRGQLQDRMAVIEQKGGGQKLLVISKAAEAAVDDYLRARSDSCPALFAGHAPGEQDLTPLVRSSEQLTWDRLCEELGIARFTTHQIRHTCATELLRQGIDSLVIAKHLGHKGLATIANYAQVGLATRQEMMSVFDDPHMKRAS